LVSTAKWTAKYQEDSGIDHDAVQSSTIIGKRANSQRNISGAELDSTLGTDGSTKRQCETERISTLSGDWPRWQGLDVFNESGRGLIFLRGSEHRGNQLIAR
jgi:hypothetical protein